MKNVNVDIVGNGNVVGNGNRTISVTNNTRINNSGGSGGSGGGGGGGGGIVILAAVVSIVLCWLYVRHVDGIYDFLTKAAFLSSLPVLPLVAGFLWRLRTEDGNWGDVIKLFINPTVAITVLSLLNFGYGRLDERVVQMAAHMPASDFWNGLSEYGHRVVLENIVGTAAIVGVLFSNVLMAIFQWAECMAQNTGSAMVVRLAGLTYNFRPARSVVIFAVFLGGSFLAFSGNGVDWWSSAVGGVTTALKE
ncbi:hypothetical protein [Paraburkholderia caffeinilytica]|uniref:hypothetical protein n=1 Tax=Paraburkholderia caffeinilytica TaxID=1761016 RepID=UPI003DA0F585